MTVTIRAAVPADAHAIKLRPSDFHEGNLWVPGWSVEAVLESSVRHATCALAGEVDGRLVALAGYTVDGREVYPWLMCASEARLHSKALLRNARGMLDRIRAEYPNHLICNHVHRPNAEARAFITHLGFRVVPTPGNAEFDFFYLP